MHGSPGGGLRRAELLPDRRSVLTLDAAGGATLWDLPAGGPTRSLGSFSDWDAAREAALPHAPPAALPAWCSVDARLGCLAVHLEPGSAFGAEAYALELGVPGAADDLRLNLGHQALCCVLAPWARDVAAQAEPPPASAFRWPQPPPVLQFEAPEGWRERIEAASLRAGDERLLPSWAVEAVQYGPPSSADPPKTSFFLVPATGPGALPALAPNKLTAPRILRAAKVCTYIVSKLELAPVDAGGAEGGAADEAGPSPSLGAELIELTCDGKPVPQDMSLAAASAFLWKQPGDMVIQYARKRARAGEDEHAQEAAGGVGDLRRRLTGL